MTLLQILVVLAVVAAVAAVAAGMVRGGGSDAATLPEPTTTVPPLRLPAGRLTADDLGRLRFSLGFRGYRMDEVDAVLDRLGDELRARQAELDELRQRVSGPESPTEPAQPVAQQEAEHPDAEEQ